MTNIKKYVPSLLGTLYEAKNAAQAYAKTDGGYEYQGMFQTIHGGKTFTEMQVEK